jgi:lipoprotein-anchoring transpeptidase ErfK/SrfK
VKNWREEVRRAQVAKAEQKAKLAQPPKPTLFEWNGTEAPGNHRVQIDLSEQKARISQDGQDVAWTYVATGTASHPTPTGSFYIMEKVADKHSNRWGIIVNSSGNTIDSEARSGREPIPAGGRFVGAPMPHWMRLTGYGIGMHGGPIPHPGSPASHGCIRLPYEMAGIMFQHLPVGTPVSIVP